MNAAAEQLGEIDPSTSILFLGSGFSLGATNIANEKPPNGSGLRRHFIAKLSLPPDTDYSIQVLTEEFAENDSKKLWAELNRSFRISTLNASQSAILSEPWRRIYTTNYDDVVEVHRHNTKTPPNSFDVSERVPNKFPSGSVVHLHGSMRVATPDNILSSLVLSEVSYVNQYLVKSPWYEQFQRDIAFASGLFVVGYSMADYHIAALLLANPATASRTTFIQAPPPNPIFSRRTASYGQTLFIGLEGFAQQLKTAPRIPVPSLNNLRSFRPLEPIRDHRSAARATAGQVYDLLVYGDFDPALLARSLPGETYAIARTEAVRAAADAIERKPALIVDGRLGNGKTIFFHLLASELSSRGWTCLMFRPGQPDISREIAALRDAKRLIVFIEQYSAAQDALNGLRAALPD